MMELDEAIKHCLEVANEKSEQAKLWKSKDEATMLSMSEVIQMNEEQITVNKEFLSWLLDKAKGDTCGGKFCKNCPFNMDNNRYNTECDKLTFEQLRALCEDLYNEGRRKRMMLHNREYSEPELKAYIHKLESESEAKDEIIRLAVKDLDKLTGWYAVNNERNCLLKISCMDCPLYTPGKANCEWRYRKRAKELIKDV